MTSKPSTAPGSTPKPPVVAGRGAVVSDKATLVGTHTITLGEKCVIHPYARLDATKAPVSIGPRAVVWERAVVGVAAEGDPSALETVVGDGAIVHPAAIVSVGATVEAGASIGIKARVGAGAKVGERAQVSPCAVVRAGEQIDAFSTLFLLGDEQLTRVNTTLRDHKLVQQLEAAGRIREVDLQMRVVKSGTKWTS